MTRDDRQNPFTPTFGSIPRELAGRREIIDDVLTGLDNGPGDPNRATIFIGPRGSGKTVLLAAIAEEASAQGWISVNVDSDTGMLDEILAQIYSNARHLLKPESLSHISSINIMSIGVGTEKDESTRTTTWRSITTNLVTELNVLGTGLLITVDEVDASTDELRSLIMAFQHFVRERKDVALIMAGLPQRVFSLLREEKVSFLRRALPVRLGPVDDNDVRLSMRLTIEKAGRQIEPTALSYAVANAKGYPFMIQLIGYYIWRQNPDMETITDKDATEGVHFAQTALENRILEQTYRDLSAKDIAFLMAMLKDKDYSWVSDIANRMGVSPKYASAYRRRLIEQGIIGDKGRGKVAFELPMIREYLERTQRDQEDEADRSSRRSDNLDK